MYKLKDDVNVKDLENYGFRTFLGFDEKTLFAVRDSRDERCSLFQYYRVGVNENRRHFEKTKYRGGGKCLLTMSVTKNDIADLIQAGLVEKVKVNK